jgi:hypothetical protein
MRTRLASALILACCAGLACAQTTEPQFYLWRTPSDTNCYLSATM